MTQEEERYYEIGEASDELVGERIAKHFFELGLKAQKGE